MATFQAVVLKGDVHIKQDNSSNIKIRITHQRKPVYISTDLFVNPKKLKNGHVSGNDAFFLNSRIRDELKKYSDRYLKLGNLSEKLSAKELKERLMQEPGDTEIDFLKFADDYAEELKAQGRHGSARGLTGVISNLKKFRTSIKFNDIDLKFLNDFVAYLKKQGVKNAVDNYMREFRLLFKAGMDRYNNEDRGLILIPHYPFRKFKFEKVVRDSKEKTLSVEQLLTLFNFPLNLEREKFARDMFKLMLCLIGINSKDLYYLHKPDKKGRITYNRAKTGKKYSIKLESEAAEIIKQYSGTDYLIDASIRYTDYINFQHAINVGLQSICAKIHKKAAEQREKVDFPKSITSNWARHTWATIARNDCRINKEDIALCMGHEDLTNKVTDIYIKYDYSIIDESNRKVLDYIFAGNNP